MERARERCNLKNDEAAARSIDLAYERGSCANDLASWERSFLLGKSHGNCSAVAYDNYCYIMSDTGVCITVYQLPRWFGRKKHFDGKARIRDYRKYMKNFADVYEDCDTIFSLNRPIESRMWYNVMGDERWQNHTRYPKVSCWK